VTLYWPWVGEVVGVAWAELMGVLWTDVVGVACVELTGDMNGETLEVENAVVEDVWGVGGERRALVAPPDLYWCC